MEPEGETNLVKIYICNCWRLHKTTNWFLAVFNLISSVGGTSMQKGRPVRQPEAEMVSVITHNNYERLKAEDLLKDSSLQWMGMSINLSAGNTQCQLPSILNATNSKSQGHHQYSMSLPPRISSLSASASWSPCPLSRLTSTRKQRSSMTTAKFILQAHRSVFKVHPPSSKAGNMFKVNPSSSEVRTSLQSHWFYPMA